MKIIGNYLRVDVQNMLHVINPNYDTDADGPAPQYNEVYQIRFSETFAKSTNLSSEAATFTITGNADRDDAFFSHLLPMGDINGDGFDDYVGWFDYFSGVYGDVATAWVFLGSELNEDKSFEEADIVLKYPSDFIDKDPDIKQHLRANNLCQSGDFNGDGFDDIVLLSNYEIHGAVTAEIFITLGHSGSWPDSINIVDEADLVISLPFKVEVANAGDLDGDVAFRKIVQREVLDAGLKVVGIVTDAKGPEAFGGAHQLPR